MVHLLPPLSRSLEGPRGRGIHNNFVMILIDVDEHPDENGAFSPDGTYVPRTIFLNAEGGRAVPVPWQGPGVSPQPRHLEPRRAAFGQEKAAADGPQTPAAKPEDSAGPDQPRIGRLAGAMDLSGEDLQLLRTRLECGLLAER